MERFRAFARGPVELPRAPAVGSTCWRSGTGCSSPPVPSAASRCDPRAPRLLGIRGIEPHSTYEVCRHAVLAGPAIVAVSTSWNHGRSAVHWSFFDRGTLEEIGAMHEELDSLDRKSVV